MAVNEARVRELLEHVERNPHLWDQQEGCRTPESMCLSAIAADLFGGRWASDDPYDTLGDWLLADADDHPRTVVSIVDPHDRARRLLGVRRCLGDTLTTDDLRRLLK